MGLTPLQFNRVLFRARQRYRELFVRRLRKLGAIGLPPRLQARQGW